MKILKDFDKEFNHWNFTEEDNPGYQVEYFGVVKFLYSSIKDYEREIIQEFADWLHKQGYIDSDYYCEEPKVVDNFLDKRQKQLK